MSQTFQIPIPAKGQSPVTFPSRCVCCGAPQQTQSSLVVNRLVQRGRQQKQLSLTYQIPHCHACARSTKAVFLAGCIPFVGGGLLIGAIIFALVAFGSIAIGLDRYGQPANANSLILGAAAGLVAGLVGGFICELASRILLLPLFGRALFRAPLLVTQFMTDSDYVAGLIGQPDSQNSQLQLTFFNDEIAAEFKTLNAQLSSQSEAAS